MGGAFAAAAADRQWRGERQMKQRGSTTAYLRILQMMQTMTMMSVISSTAPIATTRAITSGPPFSPGVVLRGIAELVLIVIVVEGGTMGGSEDTKLVALIGDSVTFDVDNVTLSVVRGFFEVVPVAK